MPGPTYTLIKGETLASSAASYSFTAIPSTFTDLCLRISVASDRGAGYGLAGIEFNSASISTSTTYLYSTYSSGVGQSGRDSGSTKSSIGWINAVSQTSNTFTNGELYIPNYASTTQAKQFSGVLMVENNSTSSYGWVTANLANSTSAITSITISQFYSANYIAGSSFYLYGISKS
jgi:hypothetical protein